MKKLPSIVKKPIKHIDLVKYSGASGDFNPIHTVSHLALEKGHPDVLTHGMFLMGWASRAIEEWFPYQRLHHLNVRFIAPAYPGESLTIKGLTAVTEPQAGEFTIVDSANKIKLTGSFELKRKREELDDE